MPTPQEDLIRKAHLLNEAKRLEIDAEVERQAQEGQFRYLVDEDVPMEERPAMLRYAKSKYLESIQHDPRKLSAFSQQENRLSTISGHTAGATPMYTDVLDDDYLYGDLKETMSTAPGVSDQEYDRLMYDRQGVGTAVWKTIGGLLGQTVGGFVSAIGSLDPREMFATATGSDSELSVEGNWVSQLGKYIMDDTAKENHLFQDYNDPDRVLQASRIGGIAQSTGMTFGIILEGILETFLVSLASGGSAAPAEAANVAARGAATLSKLARVGRLVKNSSSVIRNGAIGAWQGAREAVMNAREASQQLYEELVANGYDEERARVIAAQAGKENFQTEVLPVMAMQALQNALLIGKLQKFNGSMRTAFAAPGSVTAQAARGTYGVSNAVEAFGDRLFGGIKSKALRNLAGIGTSMVSESVEEGWQTGVNQYVTNKELTQRGLLYERSMSDIYLSDEMVDSMMGGALGGLLFGAGGKASHAIMNRRNRRAQRNIEERMNKYAAERLEMIRKLEEAYAKGDTKLAAFLEHQIELHMAENVLLIDAQRHDSMQFDTHVSFLNTALEAVENNDDATLQRMGLENVDKQFIKQHFEHLIKSAADVREKFDENWRKANGDLDLTAYLTRTQYSQQHWEAVASNEQEILDKRLQAARDQHREGLTAEGRQAYDLYERRMLLEAELSHTEDYRKFIQKHFHGSERERYLEFIDARKKQAKSDLAAVNGEIANLSSEGKAVASKHLATWLSGWNLNDMQVLTSGVGLANSNAIFLRQEHEKWSNPANHKAFVGFRKREFLRKLDVNSDDKYTHKWLDKQRKELRAVGKLSAQDEAMFEDLHRQIDERDARKRAQRAKPNQQQQAPQPQANNAQPNATQAQNVQGHTAAQGQQQRQAQPQAQRSPQNQTQTQSQAKDDSFVESTLPFGDDDDIEVRIGYPAESPSDQRTTQQPVSKEDGSASDDAPTAPNDAIQPADYNQNSDPFTDEIASMDAAASTYESIYRETVEQDERDDDDSDYTYDDDDAFLEYPSWADQDSMRASHDMLATSFQHLSDTMELFISRMEAANGGPVTFGEFMQRIVENLGVERASRLMSTLTYAWDRSGREKVNYAQVLSEIASTEAALAAALESTVTQVWEASRHGEPATVPATEPQAAPAPVASEEKPQPKPAERKPERIKGDRSDSSKGKAKRPDTKAYVITTGESVAGYDQYGVDPEPALDPHGLTPGTKLNVRVADNYEHIDVPVYDPEGNYVTHMPFSEYAVKMREYGVDAREGTPAYWDAIPMVLVDERGRVVGVVRQTGWYNHEHVGDDNHPEKKRELIRSAQEHVRRIRYGLAHAEGDFRVVVTEKIGGTMRQFSDKQRRPIGKVSPTSRLGIYEDSTPIGADGKPLVKDGEVVDVESTGAKRPGYVVEAREGAAPGRKVILQAEPMTLDQEQQDSVWTAIVASLMRLQRGESPISEEDLKAIFGPLYTISMALGQQMQDITGLNLSSPEGLAAYIQAFIPVLYPKGGNVPATKAAIAEWAANNSSIPSGSPYFVQYRGKIFVGVKGLTPEMARKIGFAGRQSVVEVSQFSVSNWQKYASELPAGTDVNQVVRDGMKRELRLIHNMLGMMRTHTSREFLQQKHEFCTVRRDGKGIAVNRHESYEQYQLGHYATDVSAVEVESGRYGTMHDPAIYIEPEHVEQAREGMEHPDDAVGENLALAVLHVAHKMFNHEALTKTEQAFYEQHESKVLADVMRMRDQQADSLATPEPVALSVPAPAASDGRYLTTGWLSDRAEQLWPGDEKMQAEFMENMAPWLSRIPRETLEASLIGSALFKDNLTDDEASVLRMLVAHGKSLRVSAQPDFQAGRSYVLMLGLSGSAITSKLDELRQLFDGFMANGQTASSEDYLALAHRIEVIMQGITNVPGIAGGDVELSQELLACASLLLSAPGTAADLVSLGDAIRVFESQVLDVYNELRRIQDALTELTREEEQSAESEAAEDLVRAVGSMIVGHFSSGLLSEARALFPASIMNETRDDASVQVEAMAETQAEVQDNSDEDAGTQQLASNDTEQIATKEEVVAVEDADGVTEELINSEGEQAQAEEPVPSEDSIKSQIRQVAEENSQQKLPEDMPRTDKEWAVLLQSFKLLSGFPGVDMKFLRGLGEQLAREGLISESQYPHVFVPRNGTANQDVVLTPAQQSELASYIANAALSLLSLDELLHMTPKALHDVVQRALVETLGRTMAQSDALFTDVSSLQKPGGSKHPELYKSIEKQLLNTLYRIIDEEEMLRGIVREASNRISQEIGMYRRDLELYSESKTADELFSEWMEGGLNIRDYDSLSITENHRHGMPTPLRVLLATQPQVNELGQRVTGVLGLGKSMPVDRVINILEQVIGSESDAPASWEALLDRLRGAVEEYPFLENLVYDLTRTTPQVRQMFVYHFAKHMLTSKKVEYEVRKGKYRYFVNDAQGLEMRRARLAQWDRGVFRSRMFSYDADGKRSVNREEMQRVHDLIEGAFWVEENGKHRRIQDVREVNVRQLREGMMQAGIDLDERTIKSILHNGLQSYQDKKAILNAPDPDKPGSYHKNLERMYTPSDDGSIFAQMLHYLEAGLSDEPSIWKDHQGIKSFLLQNRRLHHESVAVLDMRIRGEVRVSTFRDGEATVNGYTNPMMVHDLTNRFTQDEAFREAYSRLPFTHRSILLDHLRKDRNKQIHFGVDHIALSAMARKGQRPGGMNQSYLEMSPAEMLVAQMALMQDTGAYHSASTFYKHEGTGRYMRPGHIIFPTLSDKGTTLAFRSLVAQMDYTDFAQDEHGGYQLREDSNLLDLVLDQCVMPELDRMTHLANQQTVSGDLNIDGFSNAGRLFLMFPSLNAIEVTVQDEEGNLERVQFIQHVERTGGKVSVAALAEFKAQAKAHLLDMIHAEAQAKVELLREGGVLTDDSLALSEEYKGRFTEDSAHPPSAEQMATMMCLDLTVNELIGRANVQMLYVGDPALYAKDKFKTAEAHYGRTLEEYEAYTRAMDSNMGKRLAQLIAPGQHLADMHGPYNQIIAEDHVSIASNFPYLVELFYGAESLETARELLDQCFNGPSEGDRLQARKLLAEKYPKIAAYLENADTDAQEYTTATEHVRILYGQGRMREEMYRSIMKKLEWQMEHEQAHPNDPIPQDIHLTAREMQVVLQPIKPVHNGVVIDEEHGVARTMYVKTSSYPLLPQVTADTQLDGVRRLLERTERETGRSTRLAYASGVKVGAPATRLRLFNADGTFNQRITPADVQAATVVLDRDFFRIQQDVPYDAHRDIAMMSQMQRILFSNGMMEEAGFSYNGKTLTGKELYQEYQRVMAELVELHRQQLIEELGLHADGSVNEDNVQEVMARLQRLFRREADGMPEQMQAAIELVPEYATDEQGRTRVVGVQFATPIYFTSRAVTFERLMMSIIRRRMAKMRFPGHSYVVGSSAGYSQVEESQLTDAQRSRIIYTSVYDGELHAARFTQTETLPSTRLDKTDKTRTPGALVKRGQETYILHRVQGNKAYLVDLQGNPLDHPVGVSQFYVVGHFPVATNEQGSYVIDDRGQIFSLSSGKIVHAEPSSERRALMAQVPRISRGNPHAGKAQVLVPSKFRDASGKLISFFNPDGTPNETYVARDPDTGRLVLKDGMVAQELLSQVTCRIPTGSHVSMASVEIVGFLPPECGDLMVVPTGLTTQKGLDFDIDKEFMYQLHTFVDPKTGKIRVHKRAETLQDRLKVAENNFIRIHQAVYSNPSPGVQRKINRPLSVDFARAQVKLMEAAQSSRRMASPYFGTHQMAKGQAGMIGNEAIGVYANAITLIGQIQAFKDPVQLYYYDADNRQRAVRMRIGGKEAKGKVGGRSMLGNQHARSMTEVLDECLNLATDNAKEEALGKLGISMETINAHVAMIMLGFDQASVQRPGRKSKMPISIPFTFLSQPVVKRLVAMRQANRGVFQARQSEAELFDALVKQLKLNLPEHETIMKDFGSFTAYMQQEMQGEPLTAQELYDNLSSENPVKQALALVQFLALEEMSDTLRPYSRVAATHKNGVGRNRHEMRTIAQAYKTATKAVDFRDGKQGGKDTKGRVGVSGLKQLVAHDEDLTAVAQQLEGMMRIAQMMQRQFLPFHRGDFQELENQILSFAFRNGKPLTDAQIIETLDRMDAGLRAYASSLNSIGVWSNSDVMRYRLLRDAENNTSLGSYLRQLLGADNLLGELLRGNEFLANLTFDTSDDGSITQIKLQAQLGQRLDESGLMHALRDLYHNDYQLPSWDKKSYGTRKLVQALLAYALLDGADFGANKFLRYFPQEVLSDTAYSTALRDASDHFLSFCGFEEHDGSISTFTTQFFQHNPDLAMPVAKGSYEVVREAQGATQVIEFKNLGKFQQGVNGGIEVKPKDVPFVRILRSRSVTELYQLQETTDGRILYQRIDVLGSGRMSEYNANLKPGETQRTKLGPSYVFDDPSPVPQHRSTPQAPVDESGLQEQPLNGVLTRALGYADPSLRSVIEHLIPLAGDLSVRPLRTLGEYKALGGKGDRLPPAAYHRKDHAVYVNAAISDPAAYAMVMAHETIHALTANAVRAWVRMKPDGEVDVKQGCPESIQDLVKVYRQARQALLGKSTPDIVQYGLRNLDEFMATCMTEPEMQQALASVKYNGTLLERFMRAVHRVLQMLSVKSDESTLAYHAVERTLRVIEELNHPSAPTQRLHEAVNGLPAAQANRAISESKETVSHGQPEGQMPVDNEGDPVVQIGSKLHAATKC